VIPAMIETCHVQAYPFRDPETGEKAYWRDVGTLDSFWRANMELIEHHAAAQSVRGILAPVDLPGAACAGEVRLRRRSDRRGMAVDSMVSGGCIVSGSAVRRSVLFSSVHTHSYATIENSVLLPHVDVGRHAHIRNAIIDRGCAIPECMRIGFDVEEDRANGFRVSGGGTILVTRGMLGQAEGSL
jgi:glucose-1-phosphate adenylyltransferase